MRRARTLDRERVLAVLWLVGAALTAATLVLPYPAGIDETARAGVALLALATGIGLFLAPPLPDWALHAVLMAGLIVIAFCTSLGVPDVEGVMFMLPVVYSFAVFRPRHAVWYLAGAGALYAFVLAVSDSARSMVPEVAWLFVMGVATLTSGSVAILASLRERERESGRRDREIAAVLQRALLPETLPSGEGFELVARYLPASREADVGGDFYDALALPDGRLALAIGDVAGKGLTAAAVVGRVRAALRAYATEDPRPASVLDRLDGFLSSDPQRVMVTLAYLVVDLETGGAVWSSAGHLAPLVIPVDGRPQPLAGEPGAPLGVASGRPHREQAARLQPGDRLLLFTDGLVERRGQLIDDGLDGVAQLVAGLPVRDAEYTLHMTLRHVPSERGDDVAVVLFGLAPRPADQAIGAAATSPAAISR